MQSFQILVVEDFEPFRKIICSTLGQRAEFQVFEASDGLDAVRKTEQLQPDLILLDIGLPYLNGIEVAKCAFNVAPSVKVLFLTQESSPDVVRGALDLRAHGYIQKLHAASELLPAINAVLKGRHFVSGGLLDVQHNGQQSKEPEYPWQRKVSDAFRSPPKTLPINVNRAERAIAARLADPQIDKNELLALKRALRSFTVLIDETSGQSAVKSVKTDIA